MGNFKTFLAIHLFMQLVWSSVIVLAGAAFTGFTSSYFEMVIPFILIGAPIQVLPFSLFVFLVWYFVKSQFKVVRK